MRKYNHIAYLLATFFIAFLTFFCLTTTTKADYTFDDGITNWTEASSSQVGQLPIADGLSLGYAFGLAQDTSGKVSNGNDATITRDSITNSINNISYSKMNVFLNDNGKYVSSVFQTGYSSTSSAAAQVSLSSPDFMLVPSNSTKDVTARNFGILGVAEANNGNTGLKNKKYYVGTDENGNPAYKIVGDFSRTNGSANNGIYNLRAELLLRASPTNAAIVQRELYLYNPTETTQSFTILFGEDTKLGDGSDYPDLVPIYDLGNKQGLYIKNKVSKETDPEYRLLVTNQMKDGFQNYAGQEFSSNNNWAKGFTPSNITGVGAEANNNPNGTDLLKRSVDTSYALKWNPTTLAPGETSHYGSTMGVTAKPYSVPDPQKSYTNLSSNDGKNRIGDKLKFSLKVTNNGYGASWGYKQLIDEIPAGLQIDPSTLKISTNGGDESSLDPTNYDSTTKILSISTNKTLTDDQYTTVTFEGNITQEALNNLDDNGNLINTAQFIGVDNNIANASDKTYTSKVEIPIQEPDFNFSFTKQLKNETNNETEYQDTTTGKKGDIIDYQIIYKVAESSKDYLLSGAQLTDDLPDGIERTDDKATITGPDGATYPSDNINTGIIDVKQGQSVTVQFKARVTASSVGIVTNIAKVTGGITNTNQNPGDMVSNGADLQIQNIDAIVSVPNLIDFGSTNMFGQTQNLTNINTNGELIVSHPTASDFKLHVSYDNDDPDTQMKNSNNESLPTDASGLLFIRQRQSSPSDLGTFTAISKSGTPIQNETFSGNQASLNLTSYIGVGDWQLKLHPETSNGSYSGILSWDMIDAI